MAFKDIISSILNPQDPEIDPEDEYENYGDEPEEPRNGFSEELTDDEYRGYDEPEYEEPPKKRAKAPSTRFTQREREREQELRPTSKYGYAAKSITTEDLIAEIPKSFQDAAKIAEELVERKPVILTLDMVPQDESRRLVDFLSGVTYAIGGKIMRFSSKVYILTPPNINLVGDSVDDLEAESFYL